MKGNNSHYNQQMLGVSLSAVTTLTFLILLEGLLDDETKRIATPIIVSFAVSEVILDIFVISPDLAGETRRTTNSPLRKKHRK